MQYTLYELYHYSAEAECACIAICSLVPLFIATLKYSMVEVFGELLNQKWRNLVNG